MREVAIIFVVFLVAGCASTTQRYGVSIENNQILKEIENPRQIKVGAFTTSGPNKASIDCLNMYPLVVPSSSYETYIKEALVDELKLAGIYSETANTELTMYFQNIDFNSEFAGNWVISAQFTATGKPPFTVIANYSFTNANWEPSLVCANTAAAFVPAVQEFLKTLFLDPHFKDMVRSTPNRRSATRER